jgi:hypothetical protein
LKLEIAGIQENLRKHQEEMFLKLRKHKVEILKSQEEQLEQIKALFKFKESEHPDSTVDGNGDHGKGESSGNVNHNFQANSSTEAFQTRSLRLDFP